MRPGDGHRGAGRVRNRRVQREPWELGVSFLEILAVAGVVIASAVAAAAALTSSAAYLYVPDEKGMLK